MAEQNNEAFDEKSWDLPDWFCSIPINECNNTFINIFMFIVMALVVVVVMLEIMVMDMVIKEVSKRRFIIRRGIIMWKVEKKKVKITANKIKI